MMKHIKGRSSKWVNEEFSDLPHFSWQEGYGGFTVSRSMKGTVEGYIKKQKSHHKKQDFRTEFLKLFRLHEIEFDVREVFR